MTTVYGVPLIIGTPQTFGITLGGVPYSMSLVYRNDPGAGWTIDIADAASNPIVSGIPLVTGANLLAQYRHLNFGGALVVQTTSDPDAVPTFTNMGDDGQLYWVTSP